MSKQSSMDHLKAIPELFGDLVRGLDRLQRRYHFDNDDLVVRMVDPQAGLVGRAAMAERLRDHQRTGWVSAGAQDFISYLAALEVDMELFLSLFQKHLGLEAASPNRNERGQPVGHWAKARACTNHFVWALRMRRQDRPTLSASDLAVQTGLVPPRTRRPSQWHQAADRRDQMAREQAEMRVRHFEDPSSPDQPSFLWLLLYAQVVGFDVLDWLQRLVMATR